MFVFRGAAHLSAVHRSGAAEHPTVMYRDDRHVADRIEERDEAVRRRVLQAHLAEGRRLQRASARSAQVRERQSDRRAELFALASPYLGGGLLLLFWMVTAC